MSVVRSSFAIETAVTTWHAVPLWTLTAPLCLTACTWVFRRWAMVCWPGLSSAVRWRAGVYALAPGNAGP